MDNIARRGIAYQSSDYHANRGKAEKAIDGDDNDDFHRYRSCSHTLWESRPWWAVDLGTLVEIVAVSLQNRADCCCE